MAEQYKLVYFNGRGAAEPIRLIFALAGVEYEDHRLEHDQWAALKPTTRWGQVPYIEVNGEQIAQSIAIARYLARKYKLAGETPLEEFKVDELIDAIGDLKPHMRPIYLEKDEEKKTELKQKFVEDHAKPFLAKLSAFKEKNGGKWMIGKNVTWADLHLANGLDFFKFLNPTILSEYPVMKELQDNVYGLPQIKKWLETRPQTEF